MNKAFVREPEFDGRAYCPRCGTVGTAVDTRPLDPHIPAEFRAKMHDSAWYCGFAGCEVAYFNVLETVVVMDELNAPIYPDDLDAPLCACFGFRYEDVEADVSASQPVRIRQLLAKSQSSEARCQILAVDGKCCLTEVQKLYLKLCAKQEAE